MVETSSLMVAGMLVHPVDRPDQRDADSVSAEALADASNAQVSRWQVPQEAARYWPLPFDGSNYREDWYAHGL
jgi:hypothetical protein